MYDHSFRLDRPDQEERDYLHFRYGWADLEPKPLSDAAKRRMRFSDGALRLWRQRDALINDWLDGKLKERDREMEDELEATALYLKRLADGEVQIIISRSHAISVAPVSESVTN